MLPKIVNFRFLTLVIYLLYPVNIDKLQGILVVSNWRIICQIRQISKLNFNGQCNQLPLVFSYHLPNLSIISLNFIEKATTFKMIEPGGRHNCEYFFSNLPN